MKRNMKNSPTPASNPDPAHGASSSSSSSSASSGLMQRSVASATSLIAISFSSRLLTFLINQLLLRFFLSPALLGASAQLELYSITVLTFAREAVRIALQRQTRNPQVVVNFAHVSVILGAGLALGLGALYEWRGLPTGVEYMREGLRIVGAAAVLEALSEPAFSVVSMKGLFRIRARAEATATIVRAVVTFGAAWYLHDAGRARVGVMPYALGQLAYAGLLLLVYAARVAPLARSEKFSLVLSSLEAGTEQKTEAESNGGIAASPLFLSLFPRNLFVLWFNLWLQTGAKYILTQSDALAVSAIATLPEQGSYALAANYGSLVARLVFQPIEESARSLFSKLTVSIGIDRQPLPPQPQPLASPAGLGTATNTSAAEGAVRERMAGKAKSSVLEKSSSNNNNSNKSKDAEKVEEDEGIRQARVAMTAILKAYSLLALFAFQIGPHAAPLALRLLLGSRSSFSKPSSSSSMSSASAGAARDSSSSVLAAYVYFIPLLAYNGITEAFVASVSSPAELRVNSALMGVWSAVFAAAAYLFVRVRGDGARGLVFANCAHMLARALWNFAFVQRWLRGASTGAGRAGVAGAGAGAAANVKSKGIQMREVAPAAPAVLAALLAGTLLSPPPFLSFYLSSLSPSMSSLSPFLPFSTTLARYLGPDGGLGWDILRIGSVTAALALVVAWTERTTLRALYMRFSGARRSLKRE